MSVSWSLSFFSDSSSCCKLITRSGVTGISSSCTNTFNRLKCFFLFIFYALVVIAPIDSSFQFGSGLHLHCTLSTSQITRSNVGLSRQTDSTFSFFRYEVSTPILATFACWGFPSRNVKVSVSPVSWSSFTRLEFTHVVLHLVSRRVHLVSRRIDTTLLPTFV